MGPFDLLNFLLNFLAPAAWVSVVMVVLAHFFVKKVALQPTLRSQLAINFVACVAVLVCGLVFLGRDGKMVTYLGMALVCATSQWVMLRSWEAPSLKVGGRVRKNPPGR
jgi:hypothetical protein